LNIATIILAAGASRRMGRPKLLLPWEGGTVLEHLVEQWRGLGIDQIGVVLAAGDDAMLRELDRLKIERKVFNHCPELGMFSSIKCAAAWNGWDSETTHWLLSLGDQPQVSGDTLRRVLETAARNPDKICQPSREGRPRHPVVFPRDIFLELNRSRKEHLKAFLGEELDRRYFFASDDDGLDLDLDTPEDYREALQRFGREQG
jgi:molybdenum cofactor cytidylyltransferase